jgi:hypothetical protein
MNQILLTEYPQFAAKLISVAFGDGMPASAKWVREGILATYEIKKVVGGMKADSKKKKAIAGKKAVPAEKVSATKASKKAVTGSKHGPERVEGSKTKRN